MEAYDLMKPLMYVSHFFCLIPFTFDPSETKNGFCAFKKFEKNFLYYVRMIVILTIVIGCIIYQQTAYLVYTSKNAIGNAVEFAHYNGRLIGTVFSVLLTNFSNKRVVDFMNSLTVLESNIKDLGVKINYGRVSRTSYTVIGVLVIKALTMEIPYFMEEFYNNTFRIIDFIMFNLPLLLISVISLQWILYLILLKAHIRSLNKLLKILKYRNCWVINDFVSKEGTLGNSSSLKILQKCGHIYSKLCTQSKVINDAFSWQFLLILPGFFIEIVLKSFNICQTIKNKTSVQPVMVVSDVIHFLVVLEIVIPCVNVKEESVKFIDSLAKVDMNHDSDSEFDQVMSALMLQTYHQKLEFTANGVFSLDGTLIYSILGALTTYLVILLQFDI